PMADAYRFLASGRFSPALIFWSRRMNADIRERLRRVISEMLVARGHTGVIDDGESLFINGHLDSLAGTEVMLMLESDFNVDFSDPEFEIDALDTIDGIATIAERAAVRV